MRKCEKIQLHVFVDWTADSVTENWEYTKGQQRESYKIDITWDVNYTTDANLITAKRGRHRVEGFSRAYVMSIL